MAEHARKFLSIPCKQKSTTIEIGTIFLDTDCIVCIVCIKESVAIFKELLVSNVFASVSIKTQALIK